MKELYRTNDLAMLSWYQAVLNDRNIGNIVLDDHMSVLEGSIGAVQRRIMVIDEEFDAARRAIKEADKENKI